MKSGTTSESQNVSTPYSGCVFVCSDAAQPKLIVPTRWHNFKGSVHYVITSHDEMISVLRGTLCPLNDTLHTLQELNFHFILGAFDYLIEICLVADIL